MQLNQEQKELLERLGRTFFPWDQCADILQIKRYEFKQQMKDIESDCFIAYNKGYKISLLEIKESIQKLAAKGSAQAQKMMLDILAKTEMKNKT